MHATTTAPTPARATSRTGRPLTASYLTRRSLQRRAIEAVNWGIPAVNYDLMYQAMARGANGMFNQIVYWSRLPSWKNQTLTPNPDVIYAMPFFNTMDVGPVVLEIPPAGEGSITGTIMDCWQVALEDVGPAGVDKGKGGKYLILPPDFKGAVPDGYIPMPSVNYRGYALLRSILKSGSEADVASAVTYARRIKLYPLSTAGQSPTTTFLDAIDVVFDATIPYDLRFFQSLDRMVQAEPWLERDRVMIDLLKSIGIEKGKPFTPDTELAEILGTSAQEARDWFEMRYESAFEPYNPSARWFLPADKEFVQAIAMGLSDPSTYPIDGRGVAYYYAFSSIKHMGVGQFYLSVARDRNGNPLDGGASYRLTVPPNPPVTQYWSVVVYDFATHALIRDSSRSSRSSQSPELATNTDGSVDVYFGPVAPRDMESNWIPTNAGGRFEALFRFYGPTKPLFDKTWALPDIERIR